MLLNLLWYWYNCLSCQISKYLDLFPALRDFDEETSCWRDVGHGSLCVSDRVLHHALTGRKCLHLKKKEEKNSNHLWKLVILMTLWNHSHVKSMHCCFNIMKWPWLSSRACWSDLFFAYIIFSAPLEETSSLTDEELPEGPGGPGGPGGPATVKATVTKISTFYPSTL